MPTRYRADYICILHARWTNQRTVLARLRAVSAIGCGRGIFVMKFFPLCSRVGDPLPEVIITSLQSTLSFFPPKPGMILPLCQTKSLYSIIAHLE
jgi:hypothetical protein